MSAADDEHEQPADAQEDDGLTAPMQRTDGPGPDVLRNREAQAVRNERARARWESAIEANIAPHRLALDHLADTHQHIADTYDFDLIGDTRQAATWQMAGRCIGIARLICDALALGYTAEVLHLARALHEADGLVGIFPVEEGTELLRMWLADEEWARPGWVRAASERFAERLAEMARASGGPELEVPEGVQRQIYGDQSQAAHTIGASGHRTRYFPRCERCFGGRRTCGRGAP